MGKRKSSRKPQVTKKREVLRSDFTCLFCNHEKSVSIKLDRKAGIGTLECKACGQHFQSAIHYLSAAVDVYGDWVDAADAVAKEQRLGAGKLSSSRGYTSQRSARDEYEDDLEGEYQGDAIVGDDDDLE